MPRAPVVNSRRLEMLARDGFVNLPIGEHRIPCHWCGERFALRVEPGNHIRLWGIEIDHLLPVSKGGRNNLDNLVFSCQPCNASRGWRHEFPPRLGGPLRAS